MHTVPVPNPSIVYNIFLYSACIMKKVYSPVGPGFSPMALPTKTKSGGVFFASDPEINPKLVHFKSASFIKQKRLDMSYQGIV